MSGVGVGLEPIRLCERNGLYRKPEHPHHGRGEGQSSLDHPHHGWVGGSEPPREPTPWKGGGSELPRAPTPWEGGGSELPRAPKPWEGEAHSPLNHVKDMAYTENQSTQNMGGWWSVRAP